MLGEALEQYLDRQADVTEAMNRALDGAGEEDRAFVNEAARRVLANIPDPAGSGPGFRRPVVVVQGDTLNQHPS